MNTKNIRNFAVTVGLMLSVVAGLSGIAGAQIVAPVVTDVATGCQFSLARMSDGTVWSWGQNAFGQLGDNTVVSRSTPAPVPFLSGVTGIGAGCQHSVAVKSDGTVWEWGSMNNSHAPAQISGISGVAAVAGGGGGGTAGGGYDYSLALKNDGTVWAWGSNIYGKLGDGTTVDKTSPVQVLGLTGITKISAMALSEHSLALKNDGTVWAWGRNNRGEIENGTGGTGQYQPTPVQVSIITGVIDIGAGFAHSTAVTNDGLVWQGGWNRRGEYGNGTNFDSNVPLQTPPGFGNGMKIAGGVAHTLIVKNDGTVWGSGENAHGQLGDGTFTNTLTPVQTVIDNVKYIATGGNQLCGAVCSWPGHSLAIKNDNTVWAWGYNAYGEVGDGTTVDRNTPVQIFFVAPVDTIAPTAPANVAASALDHSAINVTWSPSTDNVGVTGYWLYRCLGAGCTAFGQITTAPVTTTNYLDTGLAESTTYGYKLVAVDAAGNRSADSAVVYATTPAIPDTVFPTVKVAASPDPATITDLVTVSALASDNAGIQTVKLTVDGVEVAVCATASCSYSARYYMGAHAYSASATDLAGNTSFDPPGGTKSFFVTPPADVTPPTVVSITVTPAPIIAGHTEQVNALVSDNVGVTSCSGIATEVGGASSLPSTTPVSGGKGGVIPAPIPAPAPGASIVIPMTLNPDPVPAGQTGLAVGTITFPSGGGWEVTVTCNDAASNAGNLSSTVSVQEITDDGDGIDSPVDVQPDVFSNDFSDIPLGGNTYGTILQRGNFTFNVMQDLVRGIKVVTEGISSAFAKLQACDNRTVIIVKHPGEFSITCDGDKTTVVDAIGTVTVVSQPKEPTNRRVRNKLKAGDAITFDGDPILTSGADNTGLETVEVMKADYNLDADTGTVLASCDLPQATGLDVNPGNQFGAITLQNLGVNTVSCTVDGATFSLDVGQIYADQCPGIPGNTAGTGCPFADKTTVTMHVEDQARSGACGNLPNGKPRPECKLPVVGSVVKVFDRESPQFVAAYGSKRPKKVALGGIYESSIGLIGACVTGNDGSCLAGEDHPGKFLVIVKVKDGNTAVYTGKLKNFKVGTARDAMSEEGDDDDDHDVAATKNALITKRLTIEKVIKKDGSVDYHGGDAVVVASADVEVKVADPSFLSALSGFFGSVFDGVKLAFFGRAVSEAKVVP